MVGEGVARECSNPVSASASRLGSSYLLRSLMVVANYSGQFGELEAQALVKERKVVEMVADLELALKVASAKRSESQTHHHPVALVFRL